MFNDYLETKQFISEMLFPARPTDTWLMAYFPGHGNHSGFQWRKRWLGGSGIS